MKMLNYDATELIMENPSNVNFQLHNHDSYEIYMFLEGDAKYIVEGNTYSLEPCDMIIIRKHEMHRVFHNSSTKYRRIVLTVHPEFFSQNDCICYENQFLKTHNSTGSKISADIVRSSGLYGAIMRLKKYSEDFNTLYTPASKAAVIEILYLINLITSFSADDTANKQLKAVITYINNKYTENISLDELSEKFYISKYHLCRIFKEATGLTVHKYITQKRITRARELTSEGKSISEAALMSGFGNYSSFYRAYICEYSVSPKSDLL